VLDVSDVSVSTHLRLNFQTILEGDIFCFPSKFVFNGTVEIFFQTNCANRCKCVETDTSDTSKTSIHKCTFTLFQVNMFYFNLLTPKTINQSVLPYFWLWMCQMKVITETCLVHYIRYIYFLSSWNQ
jgi:hypothetical protein